MRKPLFVSIGLVLLLGSAAQAAVLTLSCTTRDLAPGSHVWLEVEPVSQQETAAGPSRGGFRDTAQPRSAGKHIWRFEVSASGKSAAEPFDFQFPPDLDWAKSDLGSIYLKTRFKIDQPGAKRPPFGELTELTLAMPVRPGATEVARCLRFHDEGQRLMVETAADCSEAAFDKASHGGYRLRMRSNSR
jgi:hypothetical protein